MAGSIRSHPRRKPAGRRASSCSAARRRRAIFRRDIIRLINDVSAVVNADAQTNELLQVVYRTQRHHGRAADPAADLSEQVSTAGKRPGHRQHEIRPERRADHRLLDGANVEIRERMGPITSSCSA